MPILGVGWVIGRRDQSVEPSGVAHGKADVEGKRVVGIVAPHQRHAAVRHGIGRLRCKDARRRRIRVNVVPYVVDSGGKRERAGDQGREGITPVSLHDRPLPFPGAWY